MGEPELYLIKLFRKSVHTPEDVHSRDNDDGNADHGRAGGNDQSFLSMDYFDVLTPQKISIAEGIGAFMDIDASPDKKLTKYDVSMQSIPVYCSDEDMAAFEKKVPLMSGEGIADGEVTLYGNPFVRDDKHPYLSLIQVYIMPEAMARIKALPLDSQAGIRNMVTRSVVDQFYGDIHAIIENYAQSHYHKDPFVCRVYRAMSAGDFTVAISGKNPETAFCIATLLRERGCFYENDGETPLKYVFYKTFTLLSCNEQWIHCDGDLPENEIITAAPAADRQVPYASEKKSFVIRATFSSKYWSENAQDNIAHGFTRMNGRYDFSAELSEKAFKYMSRILYDYKVGGDGAYVWKKPGEEDADRLRAYLGEDYSKCMKLCGYISKGYLAYINERYIFESKDIEIPSPSKALPTAIRLSEETKGQVFISKINEKKIGEVEWRLDRLYGKIMALRTNRGNIFYQLDLLRWMLNLCRSISGLSDTRIYAAILTHQISIVVSGMEDACRMVEREENRNLIQIMEHAFVEAVYSLNTYANMIRDNNLQSLQTPNYNLESSVSIEKVLVGYGQLLRSLFVWYEGTAVCDEIYGLRQQYIPFMIPGNHDESLKTKVLFKEIKSSLPGEKLMVVWSSGFCDLTDFSGTLGILLHEVAHNLRYKGRSERNRVIMRYCAYLICDQIAISFVNDLEDKIPELMESVNLTRLICDSLYEAYWQVIYLDRNIPFQVRGCSYAEMTDFIYNEHDRFTTAVRQVNEVDKFIRRCINLRSGEESEAREKALDDILTLRSRLMNGLRNASGRRGCPGDEAQDNESIMNLVNQTINSLDAYIEAYTDEEGVYTGDISAKVISDLLLAGRTQGEGFKKMLPHYRRVDRFFAVFAGQLEARYATLEASRAPDDRRLLREIEKVRRYLTNSNGREFVKTSVLSAYVSPHFVRTWIEVSDIISRATVIYAEVASDLFMYNLVEMTPFGYLSFLSEHAPSDARIAHTYIRRFSIVMYAAFGTPAMTLTPKEKMRYWKGFVERLFNEFVLSTDASLTKLLGRTTPFDGYIVPTATWDGGEIRQPLSYWWRYVQAHMVERRNRFFNETREDITHSRKERSASGRDNTDRSRENIAFFDAACGKAADEHFAGLGQFSRQMRRELTWEERPYLDGDVPEKEELTLEPTLSKLVGYFKFLRGYVNSLYGILCEKSGDTKNAGPTRENLKTLEGLKKELDRWGFMSAYLHRLYQEIHQEITTVETLDFLAEDYRAGFCNTRRLHDEFVVEEAGKSAGCWMWPYFKEVKEVLNHPELRYDSEKTRQTNMSMLEMITELYYRAIRECASDRMGDENGYSCTKS